MTEVESPFLTRIESYQVVKQRSVGSRRRSIRTFPHTAARLLLGVNLRLAVGGTYRIVLLFGRFLLKILATLFDPLLEELQFFFMIATFRGRDESEPDYGY